MDGLATCLRTLQARVDRITAAVRAAPAGTVVVVRVGASDLTVQAVARRWAPCVASAPDDYVLHIEPNPHATRRGVLGALQAWAADEETRARIHVRVAGQGARVLVQVPDDRTISRGNAPHRVEVEVTPLRRGEAVLTVAVDGDNPPTPVQAALLVRALAAVRTAQGRAAAPYVRALEQAAQALHTAVLLLPRPHDDGDHTHAA